ATVHATCTAPGQTKGRAATASLSLSKSPESWQTGSDYASRSFERAEQGALDHAAPVGAATGALEQALGVRHQTDDAARRVANPRDVSLGPVGIGLRRRVARLVARAGDDAARAPAAGGRFLVGEVVAFGVRDG